MGEVCGSVFGVWKVYWGRGNVREVGVQGNVGRSVGKCVRRGWLGWRIVGRNVGRGKGKVGGK